jgi:hypothetical protein
MCHETALVRQYLAVEDYGDPLWGSSIQETKETLIEDRKRSVESEAPETPRWIKPGKIGKETSARKVPIDSDCSSIAGEGSNRL